MTTQTKVAIAISAALALVLGVLLFLAVRDGSDGPTKSVAGGTDTALIRPDSHVLGERGSTGVEFVEFLDFECEACRAMFPVVEQMREQYAGKVTFVVRYFPLPGHFNSERAARAVESAARQDQFEAMYKKMYETQTTWGEKQVPADDLFRSFAEELGLDLTQYDADYADPEVAARVQRDLKDGESLGVQGTPTLYLDGELLQPESVEDITEALDAAVSK
ncbi:thioredoxin [Nocardioides marmoriginsengisoli]|uniref:Thioredoxin n=1 Tax=Nocardioides marmoriginsengisoli TaxID=661483 RepID=A0A3N0CN43_9ACTN|nr:thioredoxin domain-containing protein [Nocardioides marmoriginsengisoli]RNL64888.1 thioredoxin [Nocardioides marmoriginsengisoli]